MSFLDTEPAAIHRLDGRSPWARFRITDPRQREATLRELWRGEVPLTIGVAGGPSFPALVWAFDEQSKQVHLSVAPEVEPDRVRDVMLTPGLWAAGYLHEAKVQFDLPGLVPGSVGPPRMLRALAAGQMVHLPRRRALRVRRAEAQAPELRLRHPLAGGADMLLRVADISMTGCALWKPAGTPMLAPGTELRDVEVVLDADARFTADLQVLHLTPGARGRAPLRVGCDWRGMSAAAAETLQAWIARGRRRRDLVSLSFE